MPTKSVYTHRITNYQGHPIIIIEDVNIGLMSVTNDIENVVKEIGEKEKIEPLKYIIVYKDSEGYWDGYDYGKEIFIVVRENTWVAAVDTYLQIIKKMKNEITWNDGTWPTETVEPEDKITTQEHLLRTRHKQAHAKLLTAAAAKIRLLGLRRSAGMVAQKLDVSDQTVINYVGGMCKDGFLTEAIAAEYEALGI